MACYTHWFYLAQALYNARGQSVDRAALSIAEKLPSILNSLHMAGTRLRIEYTEALPLSEFHECIDDHFESRKHLIQAAERLNAAAHQYRVIEKRLLARFKDRNPSPLDRQVSWQDQNRGERGMGEGGCHTGGFLDSRKLKRTCSRQTMQNQ